jgi:hypothetical protein
MTPKIRMNIIFNITLYTVMTGSESNSIEQNSSKQDLMKDGDMPS